jgi:autotransporter passenger strand-loop-strand repeat protein
MSVRSAAAQPANIVAAKASSDLNFLNSIGVAVHVGSSVKANVYTSELAYLGVKNVRAGMPLSFQLSTYASLAKAGAHFTLYEANAFANGGTGQVDAFADVARAHLLFQAAPGCIDAIEGSNEYTSNNYTLSGRSSLGSLSWGLMDAADLMDAVRSDPLFQNTILVAPSAVQMNSLPNFGAYVGASNAHVYGGVGQQLQDLIAQAINYARASAVGDPVYLTEVGVSSAGFTAGASRTADAQTEAIIDVNAVLDGFASGAAKTFIYELMDEPGAADAVERHFGLFNSDGTPKLAATAIGNLTHILSDDGSGSVPTGSASYSLTGLPSTASSMLLEKSDGTFAIVIWNGRAVLYNGSSATTVPTSTITLNLGGVASQLQVFDPVKAATAIQTSTDVSSVTLSLSADPIIIEFTCTAMSGGGQSGPTPPVASWLSVTSGMKKDLTVSAAETLSVYSAGVVSAATVASGGTLRVFSGGVASGTVVWMGGREYVSAGGVAVETFVLSGCGLTVRSGGLARGAIVLSAAVLNVSAGGVASGAIISAGGYEHMSRGGVAVSTSIQSGGAAIVGEGGAASASIISSAGLLIVSSGGLASGDVVSAAGREVIYGGGLSVGASIRSGGSVTVRPGGLASAIRVSSGGVLNVSSGGVTSGAIVSAAGHEDIASGGVASDTSIQRGGVVTVGAGGLSSASKISSAGVLNVSSGGVTSGDVVSAAGDEYVSNGGLAVATSIQSGGSVTVSAGGKANGAILSNGGDLYVFSSAAASGTMILGGGVELVSGASTDRSAVISTGGQEYAEAGARVIGAALSGGVLVISSGAIASAAVVDSGGTLNVHAGGLASAATVNAHGREYVVGGTVSASHVTSLGGVYVQSSGISVADVISAGGNETVSAQGLASASVIRNGGTIDVMSGGAAKDVAIASGGELVVYSGGRVSGGLTLSGGMAQIWGAVSSGSLVTLAGAGSELAICASTFSGRVAGLSGSSKIDLDGFTNGADISASWTEAANNTSGVLTITNDGRVARLSLVGSYQTGDFTLVGDGNGGTIVAAPTASSASFGARQVDAPQSVTGFAQAVAGFENSGRAGSKALQTASPREAMPVAQALAMALDSAGRG